MTTPTGVHPVADLFPMLATDEMKELAEDIAARGLLQPIVLDSEGRVLDGRNRLAACELAGVEPTFTTYEGNEGNDPVGFALAVNGQRRQMTKSQKALVAADLLLSNRDHPVTKIAAALGVSHALVSQAVSIATYARDLRDQIMVTGSGFADARKVAADRELAKVITEEKLRLIAEGAPDLLPLVDEGRIAVDDAIAALEERQRKAEEEAEAARREAERLANEEDRQQRLREQERQESLERDRSRIREVISGWPTVRTILADPDAELVAEILAGLGPTDRNAFQQILDEIGR